MKKYESIFILDERQVDDQGKAFAEEISELIKRIGGSLEETVPMGRKQFARKIEKKKSGIYYDFVFSVDEAKVKEVKDKYRLDKRVLRMQTFDYDERVKKIPANTKKLVSGEPYEQN
ncbi:MAG: 30S ribosomal protein S6 [Lentisphaerae bacterium GWF2_49_21]|nr:MAG: 30S ribosomal protein S6 [Lentisphaerae bacterium GWF2_49_21]